MAREPKPDLPGLRPGKDGRLDTELLAGSFAAPVVWAAAYGIPPQDGETPLAAGRRPDYLYPKIQALPHQLALKYDWMASGDQPAQTQVPFAAGQGWAYITSGAAGFR